MPQSVPELPGALTLSFEADPPVEFRHELGQLIGAFHSQTVPSQRRRFGLRVQDSQARLAGGLSGVMDWDWLFVEALYVDAAWQGRGVGRALMARAEAHALEQGCHSVWLDSFQAGGFYLAIGYEVFGTLDHYPGPQNRRFFRNQLRSP